MTDKLPDDPIETQAQEACVTNAVVLGWLWAKRGKPWEEVHNEIKRMVWPLEKAWIEASAGNDEDSPNNFTEFADDWLTAQLVIKRIES
jgi:hypothetical protein